MKLRPLRSPFDSRFDCGMGESAMPINRSSVEHHRERPFPVKTTPPSDRPTAGFSAAEISWAFHGHGGVSRRFQTAPAAISLYRPFTLYYAGLSGVFRKFPLKLLPAWVGTVSPGTGLETHSRCFSNRRPGEILSAIGCSVLPRSHPPSFHLYPQPLCSLSLFAV